MLRILKTWRHPTTLNLFLRIQGKNVSSLPTLNLLETPVTRSRAGCARYSTLSELEIWNVVLLQHDTVCGFLARLKLAKARSNLLASEELDGHQEFEDQSNTSTDWNLLHDVLNSGHSMPFTYRTPMSVIAFFSFVLCVSLNGVE